MTSERSSRCGPASVGRIVSVKLLVVFAAGITLVCAGSLQAQTPSFNRDVVVIDPAHGGTDSGARLNDQFSEREVTLAVASRLRSLLTARGFTVVFTRQGSSDATPTTDQRAELANRQHAVACVVVHASQSGNGVNLGTSTIGSPLAVPPANTTVSSSGQTGVLPWDRAQEPYLAQSQRLASQVGAALSRSGVPLTQQRAALKPLDNLMCPAISIEVEALHQSGSDTIPVWNEGYQQRVADAVAGALVSWRNQAQPPEYVPVPRPNGAGQ
jgi:N-acetylmuramoyl-L-alanine amidase